MITVETLIEKEVCVSHGEARRLIMQCPEWKLENIIKKREAQKWGRRPREIKLIQFENI